MIKEQLANIRLKMTISKDYEESALKLFYSPYASKYGASFLVNKNFDFDKLEQYLYIICSNEDNGYLIIKIPGGIYTHEEIDEVSRIVQNH